jgi:hypothetical protein
MKHAAHKINGTFVPLLLETIDTPAWRALSHGAKVLYLALKRRYNPTIDNNGKIYLPQRAAQKELGSGRTQIHRWFRELEHFGFIVMISPGHLGLDGKGRAPRWRLTELPCDGKAPTRDFARWNGVPLKNKTLVQKAGPPRSRKQDQAVVQKAGPCWSRKQVQGGG